jgi:HK97 family phage major capsid protein
MEATMTDELVNRLSEQRARTWEEAKSLLDHAASENRDLSAEESEQFTRMNDDIDAFDARRKNIIDIEARERAIDESRAALGVPADFGTRAVAPAEKTDSDILRELATGERRSFTFEKRDVTKASTGAPVPTSFYDQLVEHLVVQGPMLDGNVVTILTTNSGENLQIPRSATYTSPAIIAEGTAITESDPTFAAFVTLGAFKYAATFQLSREIVEDSGINLLDFVARQAATGMGTAVNAGLTVGTGTTQPSGLSVGCGTGVTGDTGVAGVPTYENLVDLGLLGQLFLSPSRRFVPNERKHRCCSSQDSRRQWQLHLAASFPSWSARHPARLRRQREPRHCCYRNRRKVGHLR